MNLAKNKLMIKEALLYQKLENNKVLCNLCAHQCVINPGKEGICKVRENRDGTLHTKVYGRSIAHHVDPVEKKPLYHFYPGSKAFSIGTPGCNFRCQFCQNWEIAQLPREHHNQLLELGAELSPNQIVEHAKSSGSKSIAYTYTEPTIFFEYSYDTAILAHKEGLKNIYVTNGYMTPEMLDMMNPYLDAANVDLKAFREETYKKVVGARLQPVLDAMKKIKQLGIWLEVTSLIIPGTNDDPDEIKDMADFIANELGEDVPWHISRFFPSYKMNDVPVTLLKTLETAKQIGHQAGLNYVYIGNASSEVDSTTYCPKCGEDLIQRLGYGAAQINIKEGKCPSCGKTIAGVGL